jgi:hypothetical protein
MIAGFQGMTIMGALVSMFDQILAGSTARPADSTKNPSKSHLAVLVVNAGRIDAKRKRSGYIVKPPLSSGSFPLHDRCGKETDHAATWRSAVPVIDASVEQVISVGRALNSAPGDYGIYGRLRRWIDGARLIRGHGKMVAILGLTHPGGIDRRAIMAAAAIRLIDGISRRAVPIMRLHELGSEQICPRCQQQSKQRPELRHAVCSDLNSSATATGPFGRVVGEDIPPRDNDGDGRSVNLRAKRKFLLTYCSSTKIETLSVRRALACLYSAP